MGKVTGFLEYQRELPARRRVDERINERTQRAESPRARWILNDYQRGMGVAKSKEQYRPLHTFNQPASEEAELYREFPNDCRLPICYTAQWHADLTESPRERWILNNYERVMGVAKSEEQYRSPQTLSQPAQGESEIQQNFPNDRLQTHRAGCMECGFQRPADVAASPRARWILNDYQRVTGVAKSKEQYRPPHTLSQPAQGEAEIQQKFPNDRLRTHGAGCMDCGLRFCHTVQRHADLTESPMARWILDNLATMQPQFAKAFPHEYKRLMGVTKSKEQYRPPHTLSQPAQGEAEIQQKFPNDRLRTHGAGCLECGLRFCHTAQRHADLTESPMARWILDNFATMQPQLAKAFPHAYKCVMGAASQPTKGEAVHG